MKRAILRLVKPGEIFEHEGSFYEKLDGTNLLRGPKDSWVKDLETLEVLIARNSENEVVLIGDKEEFYTGEVIAGLAFERDTQERKQGKGNESGGWFLDSDIRLLNMFNHRIARLSSLLGISDEKRKEIWKYARDKVFQQ